MAVDPEAGRRQPGEVARATRDVEHALAGVAAEVVVVAAPGIQSTASCQGNVLQLNWSGGIAPYQVKYITNLADPDWKNLGDPLPTTSLSLPATNDAVFYRIYGQ